MKNLFEIKVLKKYFWSIALIFIEVVLIFSIFSGKISLFSGVSQFFGTMENKTFDLRQQISSKSRNPNKDIVILAIDDSTYEGVIEQYGEWPMPRYLYADVVDYIEKQNPRLIAFDLLFVKTIKDDFNSDKRLSEIFKKYDNVYTSMNFDDLDKLLREPTNVQDKLSINLKNENKNVNIPEFSNYRPILSTIIDNSSNIGHINFKRAEDGVLRESWPFVKYTYNNKTYPHLPLLVAQRLQNSMTRDFTINKNLKLQFDNKEFPLTTAGTMYLNWYKVNDRVNKDPEIFEHIPLWEVLKKTEETKNKFKDKIVYVGSTSPNLNDIKTVPVYDRLPGVELHTTFVNNMLDGSFIHRLTFEWDFALTLLLCLVVGLSMLRVEYSRINYKYITPIHFSILSGTLILYYLLSYFLMWKFYLWVAVIMPTIGVLLTFIGVYAVRYFFKSRDYEYTYRLATTDGLTELYNHRYFQEQMIENIEKSQKTGNKFSLILTDIDFFKKFNDKYGHQAGDTVLRLVAKTLKRHVKKTDMVCRYGGEEMSVILINTDKQKATEIAQRLCDAVAQTKCQLGYDLEVNVTISLGVSTYPDDGNTPSELIEYSDKGLYYAKENGRNQVGVIKEEE